MPIPRWLSILKTVGPMIIALTVPGGAMIAPLIVAAIASAEKIPGATGPQKKIEALKIVRAGAQITSAADGEGGITIDPDEAVEIADHAIEAVVGSVNLIHDAVPDAGLEPAA